MQAIYGRLQAGLEFAVVLCIPLFVMPQCTSRRFPTWHEETIPTDTVLDEFRQSDWQWSFVSLVPFLGLWTAWQYTRSFDGSLALALLGRTARARELSAARPPTPREEGGQDREPPLQRPAPGLAAADAPEVRRVPREDVGDVEAENSPRNHVGRSKEVLDALRSFRERTLQVLCRPRDVHTVLCLTDYDPAPGSTGAPPANGTPDERRIDGARAEPWWVGVLTFAGTEAWQGQTLVPDGDDVGLGSLALLLRPVADNVIRHRSSFLTADGSSGSGKTQTLLHAATYVGARMLEAPSTVLAIYVSVFGSEGGMANIPTMPAEAMSEMGVEHVEGSSHISLKVYGWATTLPHYVVSGEQALVGVLKHASNACRAERGHLHVAITRMIKGPSGPPEEVEGALVMVDLSDGLSGPLRRQDVNRMEVQAYLQGEPPVNSQQDCITNTIRGHDGTCKVLFSHVNVKQPGERSTIEFARRIADV